MNKTIFLAFAVIFLNCCANKSLIAEYNILYADLRNLNTPGYKSSWNSEKKEGFDGINLSRGAFIFSGIETDFGIDTEGFFKIKLDDGLIGYTRNGRFIPRWNEEDNYKTAALKTFDRTADGYPLYDNITIPWDAKDIKIINNILYADLSTEKNVEIGKIYAYKADTDKLRRYKNEIFITEDNYDSKETTESKIYSKLYEWSNVDPMATLLRMYVILEKLNKHGNKYSVQEKLLNTLLADMPVIGKLSEINIRILELERELKDSEAVSGTRKLPPDPLINDGKETILTDFDINGYEREMAIENWYFLVDQYLLFISIE